MLVLLCHVQVARELPVHEPVQVADGGADVRKEDIPEQRSEDRALENHVRERERFGEGAVNENCSGACSKVVFQKVEQGVVDTCVAKLMEKKGGVDVIEGARDVR